MDRARSSDVLQNLASPAIGAGIAVDRVTQLFLLARQNKVDDPAKFAWDQLNASGYRVMKNKAQIESPEDNLTEIQSLYANFVSLQLPLLRSVGIA
jgi:hypothetical protein